MRTVWEMRKGMYATPEYYARNVVREQYVWKAKQRLRMLTRRLEAPSNRPRLSRNSRCGTSWRWRWVSSRRFAACAGEEIRAKVYDINEKNEKDCGEIIIPLDYSIEEFRGYL